MAPNTVDTVNVDSLHVVTYSNIPTRISIIIRHCFIHWHLYFVDDNLNTVYLCKYNVFQVKLDLPRNSKVLFFLFFLFFLTRL